MENYLIPVAALAVGAYLLLGDKATSLVKGLFRPKSVDHIKLIEHVVEIRNHVDDESVKAIDSQIIPSILNCERCKK